MLATRGYSRLRGAIEPATRAAQQWEHEAREEERKKPIGHQEVVASCSRSMRAAQPEQSRGLQRLPRKGRAAPSGTRETDVTAWMTLAWATCVEGVEGVEGVALCPGSCCCRLTWPCECDLRSPMRLLVVCNSAFVCKLQAASHKPHASWRGPYVYPVCHQPRLSFLLFDVAVGAFCGWLCVPVDHLSLHPSWDQRPPGCPDFPPGERQSRKSEASNDRFRVVAITTTGSGPNASAPQEVAAPNHWP